MPSVFVETPQFPSVPQLPGVPPLNINPLALLPPPIAAFADAAGLGTLGRTGRWGIYTRGGSPVLVANSVSAVEYQRDYRVSNYPQEDGAFASYNKVKTPFQAKVTFLIGTARVNFLQRAEAAVASLDLVSIITPEIVYPSANLTHYSYRRTSNDGVTLLTVEVWCEEIRIVDSGSLSKSQSTNAASPQSDGTVQPKEAVVQTSQTSSATPADAKFVTPSGLQTGLGAPSGTDSTTSLNTTIGGEVGTKLVTEVQPGLTITPPDVAISRTGETFIVPIQNSLNPPT